MLLYFFWEEQFFQKGDEITYGHEAQNVEFVGKIFSFYQFY